MSLKTTGAELKAFYADPEVWKDGAWNDDVLILVNGEDPGDDFDEGEVADDAKISIEAGVFFPNGSACEPSASLEARFKKWRKDLSTVILVVEAPKDKLDTIRAAIASTGGRFRGN